jgi:hypothetical protein
MDLVAAATRAAARVSSLRVTILAEHGFRPLFVNEGIPLTYSAGTDAQFAAASHVCLCFPIVSDGPLVRSLRCECLRCSLPEKCPAWAFKRGSARAQNLMTRESGWMSPRPADNRIRCRPVMLYRGLNL